MKSPSKTITWIQEWRRVETGLEVAEAEAAEAEAAVPGGRWGSATVDSVSYGFHMVFII